MARRKRRCVKFGRAIQDVGPAKRVCRKFAASSAATGRRRVRKHKRSHWCVFKGVRKQTCHLKKSLANRAAARLQAKCKHRVTVRSVRKIRRRK